MYIINVIPLIKVPVFQSQTLNYYSPDPISAGFLILIPIRKKEKYGLVIDCVPLAAKKLEIKKADFQLKKIISIVSDTPILAPWQIEFGMWIAEYYYASIGDILLKMLSKFKSQKSKVKTITAKTGSRQSGTTQNSKFFCHSREGGNPDSQTLILIPQISLIQLTVKNLPNSANISIIHNKLTDKQHSAEWQKIRNGEVEYIVGTRSAIFAPFANLTKIIVKNEENWHYKSQKTPRFDARIAAIKLSELTEAKLIFESPAPRIETYYFYKNPPLLPLFQRGICPETIIIDAKKEFAEKNFSIFSRELQVNLKEFIRAKKQIVLFSARRGGANFIICRDCQNVLKCPKCDKALSYHLAGAKGFSNLICHTCGHIEKPPSLCPKCNGHQIKFSGFGTEKLEMEIKKLFPKVNIGRLDGDIEPKKRQKIVDEFNNNEIQILIGTQVIFGYEINPSPLVAAISLDILLHLPDFRSSEKIFQQITYLKNLSIEKLIIQTASPDNYAIKYAAISDYKNFFNEEIKTRKDFNYPPFSRLIKLTYREANPKKAETEAKIIAERLKKNISDNTEIFGPVPAFIHKKNNQYYWNIILKIPPSSLFCKESLGGISPDWIINIEPENLL